MINLLKSVCCRNLLKQAKDEKSSGVAGRLFQLCITRFEKKCSRASIRDCCTKSLWSCPRVTVSALFTTKRTGTSASTIPNSNLYTYIKSRCKRRNSRLTTPSLANLSEYRKPRQHNKRFVNRRWTDSIFFIWLTECVFFFLLDTAQTSISWRLQCRNVVTKHRMHIQLMVWRMWQMLASM